MAPGLVLIAAVAAGRPLLMGSAGGVLAIGGCLAGTIGVGLLVEAWWLWSEARRPATVVRARGEWAVWWVGVGAICIAGAILNLAVNFNAVPSVWSGLIYEIVLVGAIGLAFVVYGSVTYERARRSKTR
jgi:uncharacterized membrane protein